jgi:predicted peroxiredoxin
VKSHLAILLWGVDPAAPHLCATPFFHAAAAAAMEVEVEVHFAGRSVLLLVQGTAANLYGESDRTMSIYDHMRQATQFGAKLYACSDALEAQSVDRALLIPELTGVAGAAAFVGRVLDPEWATLVF